MSAPIVCNCNNYGKIDYGMPLGELLPDYRTSTYRGLRHIPPVTQEFYVCTNILFQQVNNTSTSK